MADPVAKSTLDDMAAYYRARAAEYDEWFYRRGRFDHGPEANARWLAEAETVFAALDALQITGDVLELAPGTGIWTERLARTAASVTAIDASAEMIAINRAKVQKETVTYLLDDLFAWQPNRTFDAAVFGFWISHVPLERLAGFLATVAAALRPGGRIFFVDGRREPTSTAVDHQLPAADSQVMTRLLNDGHAYRVVKNFYDPAALTADCAAAGLDVTVRETPTYFIYGFGARRG
jgi:2-polyprenyl-3-methyl-5-hydroxy-6-metoxy-1,4-benzoquinol methylase